jgi:hypothetical protein
LGGRGANAAASPGGRVSILNEKEIDFQLSTNFKLFSRIKGSSVSDCVFFNS